MQAGGILLSTFKTAVADRMLKIYHDDLPHGLTDVFGMTYDQFTNAVNVGLKADQKTVSTSAADEKTHAVNSSAAPRQKYTVHKWMELLLPEAAETLACYDHPHWDDSAALTGNCFGQGYAAYLGCYTDGDVLKRLLGFLCEKAGVPREEAVFPLIVKRGRNGLQKEITYYFNYSEETQETVYHGTDARLLLSGQKRHSAASDAAVIKEGTRLSLSCWDFLILEEL